MSWMHLTCISVYNLVVDVFLQIGSNSFWFSDSIHHGIHRKCAINWNMSSYYFGKWNRHSDRHTISRHLKVYKRKTSRNLENIASINIHTIWQCITNHNYTRTITIVSYCMQHFNTLKCFLPITYYICLFIYFVDDCFCVCFVLFTVVVVLILFCFSFFDMVLWWPLFFATQKLVNNTRAEKLRSTTTATTAVPTEKTAAVNA